jgi:hypothetical protein
MLESYMKALFVITAIITLLASAANAQAPRKEVKVSKGQSVVLARLMNTLANCNMGAVPIPVVVEKPLHGLAQLALVQTDVAATNQCPAHKADAIAIIYSPQKEYIGADNVTFELIGGDRTVLVGYAITVEDNM